jgi:hypothetical protein
MPEQLVKSPLDAVNALTESVTLPTDFSVALMSGRPEMVKMIRRPNGLNANETAQVANGFGVLLQTNQALQDHVKTMAEQIKQLHGALKGVMGKLDYINDLANFRNPVDTTSEY